MPVYEDRVCPTCGTTFTPNTKNQVYDKATCRVKAHRSRKEVKLAPIGSAELLLEIQRVDPETGRDIERLATKAGNQIAEEVLLVCWRAMNRAAWRHARDAIKQDLIASGEVREVKRRSKKTKD